VLFGVTFFPHVLHSDLTEGFDSTARCDPLAVLHAVIMLG